MLHITPDVLIKVSKIQEEERSRSEPCVNNMLDLVLLFDTYNIDIEDMNHVKTKRYWEMLDVILTYFETGRWVVLPRLMAGVYTAAKGGHELTPSLIELEYQKYLKRRNEVFRSLGLSTHPDNDKEIFTLVLRRQEGYYSMLEVAAALCHVYMFYN